MIKIFFIPLMFLLGVLLVRFVYFASNVHSGNETAFWYPRLFSDFTQVAYYSLRKDAYLLECGSSYSGIALLLTAPFALIFKKDLDATEYSPDWVEPNMRLLSSYRFWIAFLLYQAIVYSALYFLIRRQAKRNELDGKGMFLCFVLSAGVIYTFRRGNNLLVVLSLVLGFLELRNSERAWKRETALILLALSGTMKLYPLFFCAFLLCNRKWFATFRMFLYFLALYFLPMLFYGGGFSAYLKNLFVFAGGENRLENLTNISFASVLYKIFWLIGKVFRFSLPPRVDMLFMSVGAVFLLFAAVAAVVTKDDFRRGVLSLCAVTLVAPVGYFYIVIFALIPAAEYLKTYESRSERSNMLFFVCFLLLGFYPLYAAKLFFVCAALLIGLGCVTIFQIFKRGEMREYISQLSKKIRKDGEESL